MSKAFTIITPEVLTDSTLVSSNAPENDHPVWNSSTNYSLGTRVIVTTGYHKIYECISGGHTGSFPPNNPTRWVEVGPTNRWAMFDESGGTLTQNPNTIVVSFTGNRVTGLALEEVQAKSVRVVGSFGSTVFYDQTKALQDTESVGDWYEYFTLVPNPARNVFFETIPYVNEATFTVTIDNTGGTAACGALVFGPAQTIGKTQYGATTGIVDYSRKEVDEFGRAKLIVRKFSKKMNANVYIESSQTDRVQRLLSSVRATPCYFIASGDTFEVMTIFGFYRDFTINVQNPSYSVLAIEVEGLT
jgi:hypothetical protein